VLTHVQILLEMIAQEPSCRRMAAVCEADPGRRE
jgi:hypothetical protein